jgi:hypothetical protein
LCTEKTLATGSSETGDGVDFCKLVHGSRLNNGLNRWIDGRHQQLRVRGVRLVIDFEFGERQANEFVDRNPGPFSAFERVTTFRQVRRAADNYSWGSAPVPFRNQSDLSTGLSRNHLSGVNAYRRSALELMRCLYIRTSRHGALTSARIRKLILNHVWKLLVP